MSRSGQGAVTRVVRAWWLVVGFLAVGVGGIGIVVPGLPTTAFFIGAAWCFARSSPRFEQWVLDLPRIGPLVADSRAGLGMPARAKVLAISTMWIAIGLSAFALWARIWIVGALVGAGALGTVYLCGRVPTRPPRAPLDGR